MGWYRAHVFPRLVEAGCGRPQLAAIRARVCAPLAGDVLEIGFGTGLNLAHLPAAVDRLLTVDPLDAGRRATVERIAASPVTVVPVGLDGQRVDLPDASVDAALSTWTLCSVPDPVAAVREIGRVLRPGGRLHFAEHGRASDERVRAWQRRLNPLQRRVCGGCELDRDIPAILAAAGLTVDALDTYYVADEPRFVGWTFEGTASAGSAA